MIKDMIKDMFKDSKFNDGRIKEGFFYLIFGVMTTAVNSISFNLIDAVLMNIVLSSAIAWFISVLFAYGTNKRYVFNQNEQPEQSGEKVQKLPLKQFFSFIYFRLFSGLIDLVIMFIFVELLFFDKNIIKLLSSGIVVILNYAFSKLFIFKKV